MPKVHFVWVDLPQDISTPIQNFWQALTNMVTAARRLDIPELLNIGEVTKACGDSRHSENGEAYVLSNVRDIASVPMEYGSAVALFIGNE